MAEKIYVTFHEGHAMGYEHRKTNMWRVDGRGDNNVLGWVLWFSRWRCYAFQPNMNTTRSFYSAGCMRTIADFCEKQTRQHMQLCRKLKEQNNVR